MEKRILVIDDDQETVSLIRMILENDGYSLMGTTDVEHGLELFEQEHPAVLILDLEMPTIHGIQVLKKIEPGIDRDFSVIILTGYGHDANVKTCYELGVYAFLAKPVHLVELKGLVRNAMLWEEYKRALNDQHIQLEELVQQRTLTLSREVELRKQTELDLQAANQLKDKMLSILTLDLRTPLSNMVTGLNFLYDVVQREAKADLIEQVTDIYNEAHSAWLLAENLFIWSRIQTGELTNQPVQHSLTAIIKDTLLSFSKTADIKHIRFDTVIPEQVDIYADRMLVYIIVHNLVSNAVKYSNSGEHVSISTQMDDDPDRINLIVSDKGIGIPADILPTIMDVSKPLSSPGTAHEKGSGLGLTICRELCAIIGGTIDVQSREGMGTTVTVKLPVYKSID